MERFSVRRTPRFDVDATVTMFEDARVATKIEGNGKIFPLSDRATDVLDAVTVLRLERSGAEVSRCENPVLEIERTAYESGADSFFRNQTPGLDVNVGRQRDRRRGGRFVPGAVARSATAMRSRGDSPTRLSTRVRPLVPLTVGADWVPALKGLSLQDVIASVHGRRNERLAGRRGSHAHRASDSVDPAILDVGPSGCAHADDSRPLILRLDLMPSLSRDELDRGLQTSCRQGRAALVSDSLAAAELPRPG